MLNYTSSLLSSSNTSSAARVVSGDSSISITNTSTDPLIAPVAPENNNALCSPDNDAAVNGSTSRNDDNSNPTLRSFSAPINGIRNLYPNYYYYSTSRQNSNSSSHSVPNSPLPPKKRMLLRTLQQKQDEDDNNYVEKHADDSSAAARSLLGLSSLLSPRNDDRIRQLVLEEAFLTNSSNSNNKKRNNNNNNDGVMMTPVEALQFYSTKRYIHDKRYDPSSSSSTYCCCQCKTTRARDCAYQSVLRVQYFSSDNRNTSHLLYCCHLHAQQLLKKHVSPLNNKNNDNNITLLSCCFIHPEEQDSITTTTTSISETTSNNKDPTSLLAIARYPPTMHSFEESNTTAGYGSHHTFLFEEEEDGDNPVTPTTSATTEDLRRFVSSISSSEGLGTCNRGICLSSSSSTKDTTPPKQKKKLKLEEGQQPQQEVMSPSNSNYNNGCLNELPISLWKDQWVEVLTGPFASQKGTVQKWGNGWVTVRMVETSTKTSEKEIVYHHRRAVDLQVAAPPSSWETQQQKEEEKTECSKAQGNASINEIPSLDVVNTSCPRSERATVTKMSTLCVSDPQVERQNTCSRLEEEQPQRKGGSDYKSWTATAAFDRPRRSIVKPQMYDDRFFEEKKRMLREARKANNSDESNSSHE